MTEAGELVAGIWGHGCFLIARHSPSLNLRQCFKFRLGTTQDIVCLCLYKDAASPFVLFCLCSSLFVGSLLDMCQLLGCAMRMVIERKGYDDGSKVHTLRPQLNRNTSCGTRLVNNKATQCVYLTFTSLLTCLLFSCPCYLSNIICNLQSD